ncbi:MAG: fusaric acid resistance domain protein, partial [Solirubrobacterales bacterium]|nr:fusaric acid resistance domain protein [Solirubrobacterales bacterium]
MTAVCMAVPLAAGVIAGHPSWGMIASLGAFTGFYAHSEPYRYRARLLAGLALALTLAAVAGTLASGSVVASVAVTGAVAAAGTVICIALQTGPPREHFLVLVTLMTSSLPLAPAGAPARGGLMLAGGAVAWLVVMSGWLRDRSAPERNAVATAFERVA